jgi:hypothetical protein
LIAGYDRSVGVTHTPLRFASRLAAVIVVPVLLVLGALIGGAYLARQFAPAHSDTPTGHIASRIGELLTGAAAGAVALNGYLAIRAATADEYSGFSRADAVAGGLADALWQGGLLLAAAAALHLLATSPAHSDS